ncbi:hypothetical protein F8388_019885 [Cannabis sativa]|uniref:Uncharacterized protein n=1 Tax=Cannabis sativa TaxID=3483 RepID=A0A7J6H6N6_CANSA|nr:hypothetical protein F8388_019885 [Cannabis sativa]KAF4392575.1 hypothetical protein G4B88_015218 [Cannabis sativa]
MVVLSHSTTFCSGFIHHSIKPTLLFQGNISCYNGIKVAQRGSDYVQKSKLGSTCVVHMARGEPYQSSFEDNLLHEPFLLTIVKEAVWWMRSLFIFLSEQPGQLKYIEWPSFPSTVSEDSYSDSCSGSVANCSTFLSRLCSQLSLGCPYKESSIINFEVNRIASGHHTKVAIPCETKANHRRKPRSRPLIQQAFMNIGICRNRSRQDDIKAGD